MCESVDVCLARVLLVYGQEIKDLSRAGRELALPMAQVLSDSKGRDQILSNPSCPSNYK